MMYGETYYVATRVVHLPKKDRNKLNYRIGKKWTLSTAIAAMHGPHSLVQFGLCGPCIAALAGSTVLLSSRVKPVALFRSRRVQCCFI